MQFLHKVLVTIFVEEIFVFIPLVAIFFYLIFNLLEKKFSTFTLFLLFLPLFFIFYQYSYLSNFFASLGQDSLSEINADFGEAIFYIKTFISFLLDPEIFKRNRFWLIFISSFLSGVSIYLLTKYYFKIKKKDILILNKYLNTAFGLVLTLALYKIVSLTITNYEIGKDLKAQEREFRKNINNFNIKKNSSINLDTIVYIGESTSALNMSLYGYPFNTTPWLNSISKDKKFIKFNNVYATHTHTTPSLLSAFSLCIKQKNEDCSLILDNKKDNLSVVDVFNKVDIETTLYSTQGSLGGHNLANKFVFNTKNKYFSSDVRIDNEKNSSKFLGNRYNPDLDDAKYFEKSFCKNKNILSNGDSSLTLLHSYAGHGQYDGYLDFISPNINFSYPEFINKKNFLGNDQKNFRLTKEYDTAIKYIDSSIQTVFNCINKNSLQGTKPMILIYFADHGESPATARGHDSSRLTYEMLHVPFLIYFNDAAYDLYSKKFKKLKSLENENLTLRFVSDLIIYLFDIDILNKDKKIIYDSQNFKSLNSKFILRRTNLKNETSKFQTFWKYNKEKIEDENFLKSFSFQDTSLNQWQINNFLESRKLTNKNNLEKLICKHRANSFIEQFKASLINGCFETDVLFFKDKTISAHEIESDTNLRFKDFLSSNFKKNVVWIDAKNLDNSLNCKYALNWLNRHSSDFLRILLEIPPTSINNDNEDEWKNCIKNINNIRKVDIGYYMPTEKLKICSTKNITNEIQKECMNHFSKIVKFLKNNNINDITFSFVGYKAIKDFPEFQKFKWHIWNINNVQTINEIISSNNIGIMLLLNNKFTNNLN